MEDGDPGADVADRDDEVEGRVRRACGPLAAGNVEPHVVLEADLDGGVLGARRNEQRALPGEKRLLGDPCRAVGRADGGQRDTRERERAAGGRKR